MCALSLAEVSELRKDFPLLSQKVHGFPVVYLDNAASALTPRVVTDAEQEFYHRYYANIHRGAYWLCEESTRHYEQARERVRKFLNAKNSREVIFLRGATEAINLVANSLGGMTLQEGDKVLLTQMEHHSNIVPWQLIAQKTGAEISVVPVLDTGELDMEGFRKLLETKTKIVAFTHLSNALGTVNPVVEMVRLAKQAGAITLVDGAQAVPHLKVDVQELGCDFYTFSGHKLYGPTGIGVLYGKEELLQKMPPWQGGGDMIRSVRFDKTEYAPLPQKFEAGTVHIAGAIGLGTAIEYLNGIALSRIGETEQKLLEYAENKLKTCKNIRIIGVAEQKASILSFVHESVHPHDIATVLDTKGVAIRTGHHCAQPLMDRYGIPATARISVAFYNTEEDIDRCIDGVKESISFFT